MLFRSANRTNHGPVWKMVVSLEPNFRAWAIYPGGQSSDIRSPHAKEFLKDWAESNLRAAQYLEEPSTLSFKSVYFVGEK